MCASDLLRSSESRCSGLDIAIITTILRVLIKSEASTLLFFGIPLSAFDLWLSPFFPRRSFLRFALILQPVLCLLSIAALSIKARRLFSRKVPPPPHPPRCPLLCSTRNPERAMLHLMLSNNSDLSTSAGPVSTLWGQTRLPASNPQFSPALPLHRVISCRPDSSAGAAASQSGLYIHDINSDSVRSCRRNI